MRTNTHRGSRPRRHLDVRSGVERTGMYVKVQGLKVKSCRKKKYSKKIQIPEVCVLCCLPSHLLIKLNAPNNMDSNIESKSKSAVTVPLPC